MRSTQSHACAARKLGCSTAAFTPRSARCQGRRALRVNATSWDPEGLFKQEPQAGIIDQRLYFKAAAADQDFETKMEGFKKHQQEELNKKREARPVPEVGEHEKLCDFFLETEATDMEYEVSRCRPLLTPELFAYLTRVIGVERLASTPDEDRLAELEALRDYLGAAVAAVDAATTAIAAPADRLKKLLAAPDKKAALQKMAAAGEIDQPLFDLLLQNIEGATAAKQDKAAEFMTKILVAARRYAVSDLAGSSDTIAPALPSVIGGNRAAPGPLSTGSIGALGGGVIGGSSGGSSGPPAAGSGLIL